MSQTLEPIDIITTGAVGAPGQRTFFIQARAGEQIVTVKCEKQQVAAIAQYTRRALSHLPMAEGQPPKSAMGLVHPVEPLFTLGAVSLEFDPNADRFALNLREISLDNDDDTDSDDDSDDDTERDDGQSVRIVMTRAQAMAFCEHTARIVEAGRPACDYCGLPINPDGHFCPRMN